MSSRCGRSMGSGRWDGARMQTGLLESEGAVPTSHSEAPRACTSLLSSRRRTAGTFIAWGEEAARQFHALLSDLRGLEILEWTRADRAAALRVARPPAWREAHVRRRGEPRADREAPAKLKGSVGGGSSRQASSALGWCRRTWPSGAAWPSVFRTRPLWALDSPLEPKWPASEVQEPLISDEVRFSIVKDFRWIAQAADQG
jgi:hypothetical protein